MDHLRLRDQGGGFYDPETEFKICRGQVLREPQRLGRRTRQWIRSGLLIRCPPPPKGETQTEEPARAETSEPEPSGTEAEYVAARWPELTENHNARELRKVCKERDIAARKNLGSQGLAQLLAAWEYINNTAADEPSDGA